MPLFGSSKKSDEKSKPQAYGTPYNQPQGSPYPQASAYPAHPSAPAGQYGGPSQYGAQYNEPPPPYTPSGAPQQAPPQYNNPYPTASAYPMAGGGAPPMYQQAPQTVYVANALDSGARVGPMSTQSIPPPPPGCPPNQAQLAAMQGHNVVLGQRQDNWFTGGTGGGYTWW